MTYRLFTGETPFDDGGDEHEDFAQLHTNILEKEPDYNSNKRLRKN